MVRLLSGEMNGGVWPAPRVWPDLLCAKGQGCVAVCTSHIRIHPFKQGLKQIDIGHIGSIMCGSMAASILLIGVGAME